jgi:hypothetical protein
MPRFLAEVMMTRRMIGAVAVVVGAAMGWPLTAPAAEKFQKLSGAQIQASFTGMEVTDDVHWADVYERGGTLRSFSMGRKSVGKWRVQKDELCIDRGKDDGGCYQVWLSGKNVQLKREGATIPLEGVLQRPSIRN